MNFCHFNISFKNNSIKESSTLADQYLMKNIYKRKKRMSTKLPDQ